MYPPPVTEPQPKPKATEMQRPVRAPAPAPSTRPAFDVEEDSVRTRDIIQDTLKFMRIQLSTEQQRESEVAALERRARLAFFRSDWAEMMRAYDELTKLRPDDGEAHYRLGYARSFLGHFEEALPSFERAAELNYMRPSATYNTARPRSA